MKIMNQKRLKLSLPEQTHHTTPATLFAQLLKRQARRVMAAVTECPPDTIPAHIARLDDLRELINHAIRYELIEAAEARPSGGQLQHPATVADYLACLHITRKTHRSPAFISANDAAIARIDDGIAKLCGLVANRSDLIEYLAGQESE